MNSKDIICKLKGEHEFAIKDNVKKCVRCGKIVEIIAPMCEIMGVCEWVEKDGKQFCAQCGREKPIGI